MSSSTATTMPIVDRRAPLRAHRATQHQRKLGTPKCQTSILPCRRARSVHRANEDPVKLGHGDAGSECK